MASDITLVHIVKQRNKTYTRENKTTTQVMHIACPVPAPWCSVVQEGASLRVK